MAKTVTLRIADDVYQLLKTAANGQRRNLSNFIEYATLQYLTSTAYVDDKEMEDILSDSELVSNLNSGIKNVKKRANCSSEIVSQSKGIFLETCIP